MQYQTNSKSQIFMLDLIVATVLIVISLGIFFTFFITTNSQSDMYGVALQISNSMSSTRINDLNNKFVRDLFIDQKIENIDNTILQQISEFENKGESELAENLTKELTRVYIQDKIGYNITLKTSVGGTPIVLDSTQKYVSINDAKTVASIQRQIMGFNKTDFYIHQYNFEVWRGD